MVILYIYIVLLSTLAAPSSTLDRYRGDSLSYPMLITAFYHIRTEDHNEPRNEVEFINPAERLVGFESRTFRFTQNVSTH